MKLALTIATYNDVGSIAGSIEPPIQIPSVETNQILVANNANTHWAETMLQDLQLLHLALRRVNNRVLNGFGLAVRKGLDLSHITGEVVVMADRSESLQDLVRWSLKLQEGHKCSFGFRIIECNWLPECTPHTLTEDW